MRSPRTAHSTIPPFRAAVVIVPAVALSDSVDLDMSSLFIMVIFR
jgi:hypothetical protein